MQRSPGGWLARGAAACAAILVAVGCGSGGGSSSGPQTRTVQVDYRHDEFASALFDYYPKRLAIRPGDTVEFKQAWTGEPHSVTMGTLVDEKLRPLVELFEQAKRERRLPEEPVQLFEAFFQALPFALGEEGAIAQNAARPCYVDGEGFDGRYPGDERTPCPQRPQPAFNGRQAIYSSGLIPYEGVKGNTFQVKVADDTEPGTYVYYCNVHGPLQYGQLVVKEKGAEIPSRTEVARQARREAERQTEPMLRQVRAARAGRVVTGGEEGEVKVDAGKTNLIGVPTPFFEDGQFVHGVVNEFVPEKVEAKVGQKVTWTFTSGHTISFNVPSYFPIFVIEPDGAVRSDPKALKPFGGWPDRPDPPEGGGHDGPEEAPPPVNVDVGAWDGRGFKSTGLDYQDGDTFSVAFTRPGTFTYACLVHPEMVGRIVVRA